mmetsp:Transcript_26982/g.47857  ORF Transcript_26982/g.47857 Transcript_26982/m.47857 type:complete len:346 (-) Transcript_26982:237-1274(-)
MFDFTVMHLQQAGVDDLCTFHELWNILESHTFLLDELVPGIHRIMWVLRAVAPQPTRPVQNQKRAVNRKTEFLTERRMDSKRSVAAVEQPQGGSRSLSKAKSLHSLPAAPPSALTRSHGAPPRPKSGARIAENFRIQAAVRFRHAVRGEWDVVNSLQSIPATPGTSSRLPALSDSGGWDKPVSWAEELSTFERRQKQGNNWHNSHRQSLSKWSSGAFRLKDEGLSSRDGAIRQSKRPSRSMPSLNVLPMNPLGSPMSNMSPEECQAAADAKVAEISAEGYRALEAMPRASARFGPDSMGRLREVEIALAANYSSQYALDSGPMEKIVYKCQLCGAFHDVTVPCVY